MSVRMRVEKCVVGNHDPLVLVGSSQDRGIDWEPGAEIVVADELAVKFERSGIAIRIESKPEPEVAVIKTQETAARSTGRGRARA